MRARLTQREIDITIDNFLKNILDGWSIDVSLARAGVKLNSQLFKIIKLTPRYQVAKKIYRELKNKPQVLI